ncbi:MAG: DUF2461 domain-containing protein [Polyangiaceae bacterium]|nr:DUF2461 domain-containing protein [Polyangiaceae bacterium]
MPTKVKSTSAKTERFEGFADARCTFFRELAKRQDRAWFAAHKGEFKTGYEEPMQALLAEARDRVDGAYPDCEIAEPKVFRIHRDVRFSPDKSPYKTHVGGVLYMSVGKKGTNDAPSPLYVQIGTKCLAAAGHYMMDGPQLARFREAVLDDDSGKELQALTAKLEKKGYEIGSFEQLKKVPRGVDPEHPRAALLKHKGLIVTFPAFSSPKLIAERGLLDEVVKHAKAVAPLVRWLTFNVPARG